MENKLHYGQKMLPLSTPLKTRPQDTRSRDDETKRRGRRRRQEGCDQEVDDGRESEREEKREKIFFSRKEKWEMEKLRRGRRKKDLTPAYKYSEREKGRKKKENCVTFVTSNNFQRATCF